MGDIFNSIFDLSGNGNSGLSEQFVAFMVMREMLEEDGEADETEE